MEKEKKGKGDGNAMAQLRFSLEISKGARGSFPFIGGV